MSKKVTSLHSSKVSNNCPTCYTTGDLEFSFTQEVNDNVLFKFPSKNITETLFCHNCNSRIYPVNWDDDIDRVHQYHKKIALSERITFKLKPLGYAILISDLLLLGYLLYYFTK